VAQGWSRCERAELARALRRPSGTWSAAAIRLNGQPVTIVGVGPERFNGDAGALVTDFWLSISSTPVGGPYRVPNLERREDHWYDVKARLAPGVTIERAQSDDERARRCAWRELNPELDRGRDITVFGARRGAAPSAWTASSSGVGAALLGVVGLVLVLAVQQPR
jgi:hypothetical protein